MTDKKDIERELKGAMSYQERLTNALNAVVNMNGSPDLINSLREAIRRERGRDNEV